MRVFSSLLLAAMAMSLTLGTAEAGEKRKKKKYREPAYRSSTVDHRGLCQRDTGRPLDSLNLNHQCDREEFWNRIRDRGGERGR